MAESMKDGENLFARAMQVLDAAQTVGLSGIAWSFGGGAVLMRRYRHRLSIGVDIFLPDPWMLGCLRPRLNEVVATFTANYVEEASFLRFFFPEGDVSFIVCKGLTLEPAQPETIQGRRVLVETSAEIVAKKLAYRAASFTARDLFDFAVIASREPEALRPVDRFLQARREALLGRLRERDVALREDFAALDTLEFNSSYEECVEMLQAALAHLSPPRRVQQHRARYEILGTIAPRTAWA